MLKSVSVNYIDSLFKQTFIKTSKGLFKLCILISLLAFVNACAMDIERKQSELTIERLASPKVDKKSDNKIKVKRIWIKNVGSVSEQEFSKLTPSVSEQAIFTVAESGIVTAWRHGRFKRKLWSNDLNEEISGGLYSGYGKVLLASAEGEVFALDADSGEVEWRQKLLGEILVSPQANGRIAVVQMANGVVKGLDFRSGEVKWSYKTSVPSLTLRGTSTPVIEKQIVYVGFANGKVAALDIVTGAAKWEVSIYLPEGGTELEQVVDVDGNLLLDNSSVYASSYQGKVVALLKQNGRPRWKNTSSNYLGLEQGLNQIYSIEDDGKIRAYNKNDGKLVWEQKAFEGRLLSAPTVQLNNIVVGDLEGYLYWISQTDGSLVAKKYLGRGTISAKHNWNFKGLENKAEKPAAFRVFSKAAVKDDVFYVQNQFGVAAAYKIVE